MPFKHLQPATRFKCWDRGWWWRSSWSYADDGGDVGEGDDGEGDDHDENDENLGYDLSQGEAQPLVKGDRTVSIFIHRLFHGGDGGDGGGDGDDSHYGDSDDSGGDDDCDGGVNIMSLS